MQYKNIGILSGIGAVAILLLVTGCQTSETHDERSEGRVIDDKNITAEVEQDLQNDPIYKLSRINVSTFAGIVQLSGFVSTSAEKNHAQQVAENVDGVKEVHNGISLKPIIPATSRKNSLQEIYSDPQNPASDNSAPSQNSDSRP
jgi:hypothetical protein